MNLPFCTRTTVAGRNSCGHFFVALQSVFLYNEEMAFGNLFSRLFRKKSDKRIAVKGNISTSLVERINSSMDLLVMKSVNLNEQWNSERETILKLRDDAKKFVEVDEILAAKFEQDILGSITALSSSCDAALAGKSDADVKKSLAALSSVISQRLSLQK